MSSKKKVKHVRLGSRRQSVRQSTSHIGIRKSFVIAQLEAHDAPSREKMFDCNYFRKIIRFFKTEDEELYTREELEQKIIKLHKYCLTHLVDSYRVHLNRLKGVALLEEIVERANFEYLKPHNVIRMVWSTLSCVYHFSGRLKGGKGPSEWLRKKQHRRALRAYDRLLQFLLPDLFAMTLQAMVTFFTEARVWKVEYFCAELLKRLLISNDQADFTVNNLLNLIERYLDSNIKIAKQILRVLYEVLEDYIWEDIDEGLLARILKMYHSSIQPSAEDEHNYVPLRRGLEVCIRNIMHNLSNYHLMKCLQIMMQWTFEDFISDEGLLDFGNLIEYAAMLHDTQVYRESLPQDFFPLVLRLVASENLLHSLLGNRVLQHLLDRHDNRLQFDTPRIYLQNTHFNIEVGEYNSNDKYFLKKYREMLHATLLASVTQHGMHRIHLENVYTSIALIVVEVPCGYTAAAMVCLAMAIQEYTISDDSIELESAHRLHATVMSIMSLICWVHKAEVFYDYLNALVERRAQFAPHLNPPLRPTYQYAQHHVLWNKPELFFEDWEVRYGLWKCFRGRIRKLSLEKK